MLTIQGLLLLQFRCSDGHLALFDLILTSVHCCSCCVDLLMGLFRGAVFRHGGGLPISVDGPFPLLNGPFSDLNGPIPECLNGPFSLLKILWKQPIKKGALRGSCMLWSGGLKPFSTQQGTWHVTTMWGREMLTWKVYGQTKYNLVVCAHPTLHFMCRFPHLPIVNKYLRFWPSPTDWNSLKMTEPDWNWRDWLKVIEHDRKSIKIDWKSTRKTAWKVGRKTTYHSDPFDLFGLAELTFLQPFRPTLFHDKAPWRDA